MPLTYYVAWWNVENLFDEENSPRRSEKLTRVLGDSIGGWTPARRDRKIDQLASVIAQMNGGAGPDLLGICEVENEFVVDLLAAAVNALPRQAWLPGRTRRHPRRAGHRHRVPVRPDAASPRRRASASSTW